jgi:hypothetical protein
MLETAPGSKLATWRCSHWPPQVGESFTVLGDHRRDYLEYEGEISGNRGRVTRIASGTLLSLEATPQQIIVTLADRTRIALPR